MENYKIVKEIDDKIEIEVYMDKVCVGTKDFIDYHLYEENIKFTKENDNDEIYNIEMNKDIFEKLKELLSHKKRKINFIMEECDEDREVFITLLRKEINEKGYERISEMLYDEVIYEMNEDETKDGEKRICLSMAYKSFESLLEELEE